MAIRIIENREPGILARLNQDVQDIHTEIEPEIFKKYSQGDMKSLFTEAFNDENVKSFVAFWNDEPAGYILVAKHDYPENYFRYAYSVLYIDQICVAQRFRGQNIGKSLIDKAKMLARELGLSRIELDFWCKNQNAGQFFGSQGFHPFNQRMYCKIDE